MQNLCVEQGDSNGAAGPRKVLGGEWQVHLIVGGVLCELRALCVKAFLTGRAKI